MAKTNREKSLKYRAKMSANHELKNVWVPKPDIAQLEILAREKGWIAETGRNAGQVNFQQTIVEVLQAGLDNLRT